MAGPSFPVVFYDGEREISLGNVVVSPSMSLKRFQSLLGDKMGISPHQLSIFLENEKGSRVPVTSRLNLSGVSQEKGWFFLVFLKRSPFPRQWRGRRGGGKLGQDRVQPHSSMMLLRRDGNNVAIGGFDDPGVARVGFETRVAELEVARERYLMNMGLGAGSVGNERGGGGGFDCEECLREDVEFHSCVNDAVIFGFRSSSGPIARPKKGSG